MKTNVDGYRKAASETLAAVGQYVSASAQIRWSEADGTPPLIRSSIVKRQYECLSIAVDLVEKKQGFAAVGFLRPACEEFLWMKYLEKVPKADGGRLLLLMTRKEVWESLKAQQAHAGADGMEALGLTPYYMRMRAHAPANEAELKKIGIKLRWDKRVTELGKLPSTFFIAKAVGEIELYNLLYHASSRYVHFSPQELLRRAWGKEGAVSLTSDHFSDYWGSFVLYWGVFLLAASFSAIAALEDPVDADNIDVEGLMRATSAIAQLGPVPIITAGELEWP